MNTRFCFIQREMEITEELDHQGERRDSIGFSISDSQVKKGLIMLLFKFSIWGTPGLLSPQPYLPSSHTLQ